MAFLPALHAIQLSFDRWLADCGTPATSSRSMIRTAGVAGVLVEENINLSTRRSDAVRATGVFRKDALKRKAVFGHECWQIAF